MKTKLIGITKALKTALSPLKKNVNLGYVVKVALIGLIITAVLTLLGGLSTLAVTGFSYLSPAPEAGGTDVGRTENYAVTDPNLEPTASFPVAAKLFLPFIFLISIFVVFFIAGLNIQAVVDIGSANLRRMRPLMKRSLSKTLPFAGLTFLIATAVAFGFLLLVVPGVIFAIMFMFAPFIMFEEDLGIIESLKRSKQLTAGYKLQLFARHMLLSLLMFLAIIPLSLLMYAGGQLIGSIFGIFISLVSYVYYVNLKNIKSPAGS